MSIKVYLEVKSMYNTFYIPKKLALKKNRDKTYKFNQTINRDRNNSIYLIPFFFV